MRLLTDPQPAIEWFCTGGSVCIGMEGTEIARIPESIRDVPNQADGQAKRKRRVPRATGQA